MPAAGPGGDLPRGVSERQGWLPPALRSVSSFMLDRAWRTERMTERSAAALAWHASLSRRVSRRPALMRDGLPSTPVPAARLEAPPFLEASPQGTASAPLAFHAAPRDAPPRVAAAPRGGVAPSRPSVPPVGPAAEAGRRAPPRGQAAGGHPAGRSGTPAHPAGGAAGPPAGPWPPVPAAAWRAALSWAGPWPPVPAPPLRQARVETESWRPAPPAATAPGGDGLGVGDRDQGPVQPTSAARFLPRVRGRQAPPAVPASLGQGGLLGRLLDEVVEPVALPGLAIRPVHEGELPGAWPARPAEPPPARPARKDAASWAGRRDAPGAEGADGARPWVPDPRPAPAEPDVDAVAEQVYQRLLRRHRLERERRGRY
jgi:hypothetical protein